VPTLVLGAVVAAILVVPTPIAHAAAQTFTVVDATDDSVTANCEVPAPRHCTLRDAINAANANAGTDTIQFAIDPSTLTPIVPATALPPITEAVLIDGYTQSGASPNTAATTDNAVLNVVINCNGQIFPGLEVASNGAGSTIKGLVIQGCQGSGIPGIKLSGGDNHVVGNFIGTTAGGTDNSSNTNGIEVNNSSGNVIGGTDPADRNLISGNTNDGVRVFGALNTVQGNFIGTSASGADSIPNGNFGVLVGAESNTIGGVGAGAGNVISGNGSVVSGGGGIVVQQEIGPGSTIQGNLIGTASDGTTDLGNGGPGVYLASRSNIVGGTAAGEANTIAFNDRDGVWIYQDSNQLVGNDIFSNGGTGVAVFDSVDNLLSRNLMHGNGSLSIDLNGDGPTPNDPLDPDDGANRLQNFPDLDSAISGAAGTTIQGSLNSAALTTFTLEFFSGPDCDSDGRGQATKYLGTKTVMTDAAGDVTFTAVFPTSADPGDGVVSATATDPDGNTSEMSECANLVAPGSIAFTSLRTGNRDIFLMNGDGSRTRRLTMNPAADYQPALAPGQVVFVSNRDGNRELYTMDLNGHHVTRLTHNPAGDFEPSVGPDGQIAFTSTRDGNREIYLLTPSAGTFTLTRLTNNPAADYDPSVGPDGDILFVSNRSGHREIYRWQPSGPPVRLTDDPAGNFEPAGREPRDLPFRPWVANPAPAAHDQLHG
jgi:CSLREA domain-containing protein